MKNVKSTNISTVALKRYPCSARGHLGTSRDSDPHGVLYNQNSFCQLILLFSTLTRRDEKVCLPRATKNSGTSLELLANAKSLAFGTSSSERTFEAL